MCRTSGKFGKNDLECAALHKMKAFYKDTFICDMI